MPDTLTRPLLRWFDRHQRPMPWKADRDAYHIWISEVMLQQTTVAAVIPYFERFIARFPTMQSLAAAPEEHVLKLWEGLGYYRRARHLHAASKRIVNEFDGMFPRDREAAASLPGVGRYILGAVLSQAYEARVPIVEANSLRLLARLFAYREDPRTGTGMAWAWDTATRLLPRRRIGDFNQALMELGSQVCTPVNPKCGQCPLRTQCSAYQGDLQLVIPPPKRKVHAEVVDEVALVIARHGRVLVVKRPADSPRWAGYWEFPHAVVTGDANVVHAATTMAHHLTGLNVSGVRTVMEIAHTITRFRVRMQVCVGHSRAARVTLAEHVESRWVPLADCEHLPMPTPQRRIVRAIINNVADGIAHSKPSE